MGVRLQEPGAYDPPGGADDDACRPEVPAAPAAEAPRGFALSALGLRGVEGYAARCFRRQGFQGLVVWGLFSFAFAALQVATADGAGHEAEASDAGVLAWAE